MIKSNFQATAILLKLLMILDIIIELFIFIYSQCRVKILQQNQSDGITKQSES